MTALENGFHVSTITAVSKLSYDLDLCQFFNGTDVDDHLIYIEYGENKYDKKIKGAKPVKTSVSNKKVLSEDKENDDLTPTETKAKDASRFDNQATLVFLIDKSMINMKLFKNGIVQMTGIKREADGRHAVEHLIDNINANAEKCYVPLADRPTLMMQTFDICMMNGDFRFDFEIKRDVIYDILSKTYHMDTSYEPCIYPGVKVKFFHNEDGSGICNCTPKCTMKSKNNTCRKTTVSIFQSGCTIITGARSIEDVDTVYNFISDLVNKHKPTIQKLNVYAYGNNIIERDLGKHQIERSRIKRPARLLSRGQRAMKKI
jgi:TATA-box binding protein (TBP) (component of TFIID and TFIIIB)